MPCHTLKNTTCCHPLQVFQAQAGEAQRAHPLLGQLQVEPAQVEGALLRQVGCAAGRRRAGHCWHLLALCINCTAQAARSRQQAQAEIPEAPTSQPRACPPCLQVVCRVLLDGAAPDAVGEGGVRSKPGWVHAACRCRRCMQMYADACCCLRPPAVQSLAPAGGASEGLEGHVPRLLCCPACLPASNAPPPCISPSGRLPCPFSRK